MAWEVDGHDHCCFEGHFGGVFASLIYKLIEREMRSRDRGKLSDNRDREQVEEDEERTQSTVGDDVAGSSWDYISRPLVYSAFLAFPMRFSVLHPQHCPLPYFFLLFDISLNWYFKNYITMPPVTGKRKSAEDDAYGVTTPTGSPPKKLRITRSQKQALIDNLQLESMFRLSC